MSARLISSSKSSSPEKELTPKLTVNLSFSPFGKSTVEIATSFLIFSATLYACSKVVLGR